MEDHSTKAWFSLCLAAMVGASVAAASAFWLHKRALDEMLARLDIETVERRKYKNRSNSRNRRLSDKITKDSVLGSSNSLPEMSSFANGIDNSKSDNKTRSPSMERSDSQPSFAAMSAIPPGLPRVQTRRDGQSTPGKRSSSGVQRPVAVIRPTTPRSPVGGGVFESMEGSDEEDHVLHNDDDSNFMMADEEGEIGTLAPADGVVENELEENVKPKSPGSEKATAATIIRSHSIPGELHGMHAPDPVAADILRKIPEQETFVRLNVSPLEAPSDEEEEVCLLMQECLKLRDKYVFREREHPWEKEEITDPSTPKPNLDPFNYQPEPASMHTFKMVDGVVRVYPHEAAEEELYPVLDATSFFTDMHRILRIISLGNVRTLCHHRLRLLEQKFSLHLMLNADREFLAQKSAPHRDLYNVRKVDTHVHHSSCMNQKHLLRFIKSKLRKEPDEVVIFRDGKYLTLREVFESLDLTGYDLNVDLLDVHADKNTFHRFDKFNLKYNPCGQRRFLAELTKQVFSDLQASKYQMAEYRISIYGRKQSEWDQLASWIVNNELYSENVMWLIQLPRLYNVYKDMGIVTSFQTLLDNVFLPLFEVTVDPASHPQLHVFLKQVVGFDMVDDESKPERRPTKHMQTPEQWNNPFNPAYSYWAYYAYANLYTLNKLRESKGMPTIKFRPHSGEAGDLDHLAATFLVAHNIAHGNNLRKSPGLQYLYYLAQIGLSMSPLSNNSLFLDYHRNPFPMFFARGLNVSLSTDDPLQIHLTKEPLVEEYSIAAQVWKLSACDLCEIARNSVYQSGFFHPLKAHWVGKNYFKRGPEGNDIHKTNVPHMRVEFRHEVWREELQYVNLGEAIIPEEYES
ncbi:hypothetical protein AXG93_3559s1050 [Marchantia polymorpha subsp. ruderalis]|uniref:AMP deaminase n=1 Tax=Marchantia polymorpha subsp. ruderalis TaxID=1480154 RepID=A0A176WLB9_MARPO|nr:hypothetical protein AXG93_3559s1050 [Marchantia polymorpha subsp. ruderalis]